MDEAASARLALLAEELPRLCEPITPVVLFLEGSALHGELCGVRLPAGEKRFLSDLDLGIVTRKRVPSRMREALASLVEDIATERAGDGPPVKIGFYCEEDLGSQDPTPGFVEAVRQPLALWGDPGALARFEVPDYERIPSWEGRRLASNRVLEWLAAGPGDGVARAYAAAKLMADLAAVSLLSRNAYRGGGYAERLDAADRLDGLSDGIRHRMRVWTEWRLEPCWERTPLGVGLGDLEARSVVEDVRAALLESMRFAAMTKDPGEFLGASAIRGRAWVRSWKRWLRRSPRSLSRIRPGWVRRTPRVLLFEAAIRCALGLDETATEIVDRLTGHGRRPAVMNDAQLAARIVEIGEMMRHDGVD